MCVWINRGAAALVCCASRHVAWLSVRSAAWLRLLLREERLHVAQRQHCCGEQSRVQEARHACKRGQRSAVLCRAAQHPLKHWRWAGRAKCLQNLATFEFCHEEGVGWLQSEECRGALALEQCLCLNRQQLLPCAARRYNLLHLQLCKHGCMLRTAYATQKFRYDTRAGSPCCAATT